MTLLCIVVDSEEKMTALRGIQRRKRTQGQPSNDVQFRHAVHARDPDTPMEKFGSIRSMMGSARESFMDLLTKQMLHELTHDDIEQNWKPSELFSTCAVVFLGSGTSIAVVNHSGRDITLSRGMSFSAEEVKEAIKFAINQGEADHEDVCRCRCGSFQPLLHYSVTSMDLSTTQSPLKSLSLRENSRFMRARPSSSSLCTVYMPSRQNNQAWMTCNSTWNVEKG
jgi:hypothetical protein